MERRVRNSNGTFKKGHKLSDKHGMCKSSTYSSWQAMIERCRNPNHKAFKNYGGRGIKVCERWQKFENFLEDMGENSDNLTLDRINSDGNYESSNCRWATRIEQNNNTSRNFFIEFNNQKKTVAQWGRELGIKPNSITHRLRRGWTIERALSDGKHDKQDIDL